MNEPRYTNRWFADYIEPTWEEKLKPLAGEISRYLEIGVCEGQSFRWVLENLLTDPEDHGFGVDSYMRRHGKIHKANRSHNLAPWKDQVTILEKASAFAMREPPLNKLYNHFDLIYVDGSHLACDTLEDLVLSWRLLRRGGRIVIDDYHRPFFHGKPCTNIAAHAWLACLAARSVPDDIALMKQLDQFGLEPDQLEKLVAIVRKNDIQQNVDKNVFRQPDPVAKRGGRVIEEWRIIRPEHAGGEPRQVCYRKR